MDMDYFWAKHKKHVILGSIFLMIAIAISVYFLFIYKPPVEPEPVPDTVTTIDVEIKQLILKLNNWCWNYDWTNFIDYYRRIKIILKKIIRKITYIFFILPLLNKWSNNKFPFSLVPSFLLYLSCTGTFCIPTQ